MGDESDAIASGQRQIVMQSVYAAIKYNTLERKFTDGAYVLRDPKAGSRPTTNNEADELASALREQLIYWDRTKKIIPPGEVRDAILGGDPVEAIREALRKTGRR